MQISKYFASMGIEVDKSSIKKVDKALDHVENRLNKLGKFANSPITLSLGRFDVDQRRLNMALGNALDMASTRVVFEITRFAVDQQHLNRIMTAATMQATRVAGQNATIRPNVHVNGVGGTRTGHIAGAAVGGGLIGRGLSGFYGPALALGLGGYGLSTLNQRNQQIVSAQLGNTAVVGPENGPNSFEWLKRQGNELGFNWLEQAPEFTGFLGSATPLMGYDKSLETYKAFNEFATTRHADPVARKRALKAIQQMAAKGQVNTEELQNQLGDAANFGELPAVFARAYQEFIGGNKSGAEASQALKDAMKKGQVKTGDVLPIVTRMLAEMAAPTLEKSKTSSQSEQGRYQNSINELATIASNSGVEEGFARIFRTLNAGLSESGGLVRTLSEGFNEATKWADDLLLWPQDFVRALEGRDSLIADWLGVSETRELRQSWMDIKTVWKDITSIPQPSWMPDLLATTKELARLLELVSKTLSTSQQAKGIIQEEYDKDPSTWGNIKGLAKANWFTFSNTMDAINPMDMTVAKNNWGGWLGIDSWKNAKPDSGLVQSVEDINSQSAEAAKALAADKAMGITNSNQIDIVVNVDGSTLQGLDANAQAQAIGEAVANMFVQSFDQVNVQFPIK